MRNIVRQARQRGEVTQLPLDDPGIVQDVDTLDDPRFMHVTPC